MDHHCPWIANCISLNSGKSFLLFCLFSSLTTAFWGITCLRYFIIPKLFKFNWLIIILILGINCHNFTLC